MILHPYAQAFAEHDHPGTVTLLAQDVIFHSPVIGDSGFEGRAATSALLEIVYREISDIDYTHGFGNDQSARSGRRSGWAWQDGRYLLERGYRGIRDGSGDRSRRANRVERVGAGRARSTMRSVPRKRQSAMPSVHQLARRGSHGTTETRCRTRLRGHA